MSSDNAKSSADGRIKVAYVIGCGRSGSTLLSSLLGKHSQIANLGEVYNYSNFFQSAAKHDRHCGCGTKLLECPTWAKVRSSLKDAIGDEFPTLKDRNLNEFQKNNETFLEVVAREMNAPVLLDTSKRFYRLRLLLKCPNVDVRIIHMVRDPRAYALSQWTKSKQSGATTSYYAYCRRWLLKNLAVGAFFGRRVNYLLLTYESLSANSEAALRRVISHCQLSWEPHLCDQALNEQHDFSGNSRQKSQRATGLEVTWDSRYLNSLSSSQWALGTAITLPLLPIYGYGLRRDRIREAMTCLEPLSRP